MLIYNHFLLMNTQQELDRTLLEQDFGRDTPMSDSLEAYRQAARMYARIENAIAVLSDLRSNRSYIYYGGAGEALDMSPAGTCHETASIWEKEIFDHIHPDDLVRKHAQELRFFHFVKAQPAPMRSRYYLEMYVRMKAGGGGYVPVRHRMYYVVSQPMGNIGFALCLYTLCAALLPDALIDSLTGKQVSMGQESCGDLLSKREKEILELIARGKTSKEVADYLSISVHTVSRHRQNILAKLRVDNSIRALEVAKELRFI